MVIQPQIITKKTKWTRPSDWLSISHLVTNGEEKLVGLYAVWNDENLAKGFNNYCAIQVNGNYTVDWGDGNVINYNSGVQAEHQYAYSGISESTICSRGYKQVIITITPQSGQHLTSINLGNKHSSVVYYYSTSNWLDVKLSATNLIRIWFWAYSKALWLEQFKGYQITNACTNMTYMFYNCNSLQSLDLSNFNTAAVTNMSTMFTNCNSLQSLDLSNFNTSAVTSMSSMFQNCTSLQSLDLSNFNTAAVTNMTYMFYYCTSLQSLDLSNFNTAAVTNMASMFYNCNSLQSLDLSNFNTAAVTNMSYMFSYCNSLQSINLSGTTLLGVTDNTNITLNCYTMSTCRLPGISKTFSVASSKLDASALNLLFGDLKDLTGYSSQTITITGCPGASTCNQSIATAKNWVVIN